MLLEAAGAIPLSLLADKGLIKLDKELSLPPISLDTFCDWQWTLWAKHTNNNDMHSTNSERWVLFETLEQVMMYFF